MSGSAFNPALKTKDLSSMLVTVEVQVADTPCEATIDTATMTVIEVTAAEHPALVDLKTAQAMALADRTPDEIVQATGWLRDEDGAWLHDPRQRTQAAAPMVATGRRPITRDPNMDQAIVALWAAGHLKEAGLSRAA
jgi:hypothetical protein